MNLESYEIIEKREIEELNSIGYILRHKKSGARIVSILNDDPNKVFYIGFKTPVSDSTGVPHILEHSVLCGSKNFPVKDPFVELVKGSLNTFLNAMTYSDKTVFPVASCNDKDFQNLCHVYLDAVFYPNIYKYEEIFRQEGWSYNLESADDKLTYNGVVYNEMKGAFSSPDDVLNRTIESALFPDTTYGFESGGDPDYIPTLKYQDFLAFHQKYYHPSNSYIYLYGDIDLEEKLKWMDEEYLSNYERTEVDSEIALQKPFDKVKDLRKEYPVAAEEPEEDNTYLSYSMVVGTGLERDLYYAFGVIEYALITMPGALVKQALIDAGIGKDIYGGYDNGILQPSFSIIAKNANENQKDDFVRVIRETLEKIVLEGIDKKTLKGALNSIEFKYREADFGSYPKGLIYGLDLLDSWLYDDNKPFIHIQANDTFEMLKAMIDTHYYEDLIQKYLINNTHGVVAAVVPKKGLTSIKDEALDKRLQEYKNGLSEKEIKELVDKTQRLLKYQDEDSTQEELKSIPMLEISDIDKKAQEILNDEQEVDDIKVLWHNVFTNNIAYTRLVFNADGVSNELLPYLALLKATLGLMDTENYSYAELSNEVNIYTGGININLGVYNNALEDENVKLTLEISSKAFYDKLSYAFDFCSEVLFRTKFEDCKRLHDIIRELKSKLQMSITSGGHTSASIRAMSYFSESAYISDTTSGISFYRFIENVDKNFDSMKDDIIMKFRMILKLLVRKENLLVSFTADKKGFSLLSEKMESFAEQLYTGDYLSATRTFSQDIKNEGLKTSAQVQYVAKVGNFKEAGFEFTGVMRILKVIMNYDYLWKNIRVKGGAYGCMSACFRNGDSYFVSYRDPNLTKTIDIYDGIPKFLEEFKTSKRDLTKFVIGTISEMDVPLPAKNKGIRSLSLYLSNISYDMLQKERNQILNVTCDDVRALAPIIKAVLNKNALCVIGNENKIEEDKALFKEVHNLFD